MPRTNLTEPLQPAPITVTIEALPAAGQMQTPDLVDRLGNLKAVIADLTERETMLKEELIRRAPRENDLTEFEGTTWRATVSRSIRAGCDKTLAEVIALFASPQWAAAHRTETNVVTVRCVARTRSR